MKFQINRFPISEAAGSELELSAQANEMRGFINRDSQEQFAALDAAQLMGDASTAQQLALQFLESSEIDANVMAKCLEVLPPEQLALVAAKIWEQENLRIPLLLCLNNHSSPVAKSVLGQFGSTEIEDPALFALAAKLAHA